VQLGAQLLAAPGQPEHGLELQLGRGPRGAKQLALVLAGEDAAVVGEEGLLGPRPHRLGVEQQPVVVEHDRVEHGGG
jgi:hypothetical protein